MIHLDRGASIPIQQGGSGLAVVCEEGTTMRFTRITVDPKQMGGVPCIRHLRIPVATVVSMVSEDMSPPRILEAYPDLQPADIREALQYAAEAVKERELPLLSQP